MSSASIVKGGLRVNLEVEVDSFYIALDKLLFRVCTKLKILKKQFKLNLWDKYPNFINFASISKTGN